MIPYGMRVPIEVIVVVNCYTAFTFTSEEQDDFVGAMF